MSPVFKLLFALIGPLLLTGCLLIPGQFDSKLKLMKDGRYTFSYSGEMQFYDPDNSGFGRKQSYAPFNENGMKCYNQIDKKTGEITERGYEEYFRPSDYEYEGYPYRIEKRDCSDKEKTDAREGYESGIDRRNKNDTEKMAMYGAIFGGAVPGDDEQLKKFAKQLQKYDGWNKVEYLGEDNFSVEYAVDGRFDQNFTFPSFPGATLQFPFVQIIRRSGGELEMLTPAMAGPGGLFGAMVLGKSAAKARAPETPAIDGNFVLETDGEILTNNSEDGYTNAGEIKAMTWKVDGKASLGKSPRAIIKLSE